MQAMNCIYPNTATIKFLLSDDSRVKAAQLVLSCASAHKLDRDREGAFGSGSIMTLHSHAFVIAAIGASAVVVVSQPAPRG
jgi:hypothetical protein